MKDKLWQMGNDQRQLHKMWPQQQKKSELVASQTSAIPNSVGCLPFGQRWLE
jgi:hypothetical protein